MIKAIVVDDEPQAVDIIKIHASKLSCINIVDTFYKPENALEYLKNNIIDLAFLDINMPGISGFEILKRLNVPPKVIFTTAYDNYAVDSYRYGAVDYLLKPIDFDTFRQGVDKVEKLLRVYEDHQSDTFFFIKDGTKTIKLFYNDISLIKGCGNYVEFITSDRTYISRITMSELIKRLPARTFIRVHNSFIVNVNVIEKIENNHIYISDNRIPLSNSYRDSFLSIVENYTI